ncbi:type IV pilus modification protein PilV [Sideroxydans sp.]
MSALRHAIHPSQRGFSMLEILITLVIIATALLGTAGLQLYAMKVGKNSEFRTQAVFLAADLAERMEANKAAAITGAYAASSVAAANAVADCWNNACNGDSMAQFDLSEWETLVAQSLPGASWSVAPTITNTPPSVTATYDIQVRWSDRDSNIPFSYTLARTLHFCPPANSGCS